MNTLFDIDPVLPNGFVYHPDFITEAEEIHLLKIISTLSLEPMQFHEYEARRKVLSFGKGWSFTDQVLKKGKDIPADFDFLVDKLVLHLSLPKQDIAQFLITEYPVGSVINWHRDAPPFDIIAGVSLLSDCTFKLRPHDKAKQNRKTTIPLTVKRRSLYTMQGEAKSEWQHSTAPAKQVRFSLTFRTLKNNSKYS